MGLELLPNERRTLDRLDRLDDGASYLPESDADWASCWRLVRMDLAQTTVEAAEDGFMLTTQGRAAAELLA